MKKIKLGVILLLLILSSTFVFAIPNPSNAFYVYDESNIMNSNTENYIIQTNDELYEKTGAQIVVASIDDLEEMNINTYATALFEKWKIGGAQLDNGILILIAPSQGEIWIEVGYGLEGIIPDIRAKQIIEEYIIPSFAQGDYNQGIILGYNEVLNYVQEEYNIELSSREGIVNPNPQADVGVANSIPRPLIIIGIIILIFLDMKFFGGWLTFSILRSIGRGGRGGRGGGSGRGGGGGRSGGGGAGGRW